MAVTNAKDAIGGRGTLWAVCYVCGALFSRTDTVDDLFERSRQDNITVRFSQLCFFGGSRLNQNRETDAMERTAKLINALCSIST